MKTQIRITPRKSLNSLRSILFLLIVVFLISTTHAQSYKTTGTEISQKDKIIKGLISDNDGPLESASIVLKSTQTGTSTDKNGLFTFPIPLKTGDVLLITYLGFEPREVKIKEDTSFLKLTLTEDLVEFVGAINTNKPYKSKRSN